MSLLVVVGATGNQGGAVVDYFLKTPAVSKYKLRGLTRNTESSASKKLQDLGVEMVQADLDDVESLRNAFRGATHIFANTDSNQATFKALQDPSLLKPGQDATEYGVSREKQFGANITEAAASTASLQRIIWSGVPSPTKWSHGKYTKIAMFDMKGTIGAMLEAKPELKGKLSMVFFGFFLDNAIRMPDIYAPKRQKDGVYELGLPMSGDAPVPLADVPADAGKWVRALCDAPAGTKLLGATQVMSWSQWLSDWGRVLKLPVRYVRVNPDDFAEQIPAFKEAITEAFQYVGEFGYTGGDPDVVTLGSLDPALSKTLSSVDSQISRTDWSAITGS